jgi:hypothetical protein
MSLWGYVRAIVIITPAFANGNSGCALALLLPGWGKAG